MRKWFPKALALAGLVAGLAAAAATAAGPTPGFAGAGVFSPTGAVRYVAVPRGSTTFVKAVGVSDGRMLGHVTMRGVYGVPLVAYDGTAGGLTRDGKRLVLETEAGRAMTRFAVLATKNLRVQQSFSLPGTWAYDALSADGKTLYLIQILSSTAKLRYLVRAYDLGLSRLVDGAIADKSEKGPMTGYPLSRVASADGTWAYTLYQRQGAQPFIQALNTSDRLAVCIDLEWKGDLNNLGPVRLTLSPDEKQLVIRTYSDGKAVMTVAAPR
jgi:hypothetical protein